MERNMTGTADRRVRHIAVHRLITPTGEAIEMCVVDITDGVVTGWHPMEGEEPFTEWHGGTMDLRDSK